MDRKSRRLWMGLQTVLGLRRQGFLTPYRYADTVQAPTGYPHLEHIFAKAEPSMNAILDTIDAVGDALAALNGPPPRPRWDQSWFPRLDGAAAFAIVREASPKRIVEVGSGHSTRMLCHAARPGCEITCIDPEPRAALRGLPVTWRERVLSDDDLDLFGTLERGDIAFFDSSHVLWPGSDVDIMLNRIIPALAPGVLVHLHDILLPDPYPESWAWRGYTEQNGAAPLLLGAAEVVFSSHYARTRLDAATRPGLAALPLAEGAPETSLWLRRR